MVITNGFDKERMRRYTGIGFELCITLASWSIIALSMRDLSRTSLLEALPFLLVSAGARWFSFPLSGLVRGLPPSAALSLDGAILVAGALSVGAAPVAAGLALILSIDSLARAIVARRSGRIIADRPAPRAGAMVREAVYAGGLGGALLLCVAAVFGGKLADARAHAWLVPALGGGFLVAHALVQIVHTWLFGKPVLPAVRRALIAVLAESTLLPLGAVIVRIWDPHHTLSFTLLGGTYLLVNVGFFRIAHITAALRRRVRELNAVARTTQAMAAEVDTGAISGALLREIHRALPAASLIELRLGRIAPTMLPNGELREPSGPATGVVERYSLEQGRSRVRSSQVPANEWDRVPSLAIEDHLTTEDGREPPLGAARARIVAPLKMYGEQLGVLVAESRQPSPFGEHEARLIEAVVGQAASALENARLHALANFDGLTGLYCRRYFDTRLLEEIERARRFDSSFCVILLDIDNFKKLNDSRGHLAGDRALREVARIASAQLRNVDLAARYGGEELVFILPRTTLTDAHVVAERIRDGVATHVFPDIGRITVSIGVAAFGDTSDDVARIASNLVGRADIALYRAKSLGKDRVEVDLGPIELTPSLAPVTRRRRA